MFDEMERRGLFGQAVNQMGLTWEVWFFGSLSEVWNASNLICWKSKTLFCNNVENKSKSFNDLKDIFSCKDLMIQCFVFLEMSYKRKWIRLKKHVLHPLCWIMYTLLALLAVVSVPALAQMPGSPDRLGFPSQQTTCRVRTIRSEFKIWNYYMNVLEKSRATFL